MSREKPFLFVDGAGRYNLRVPGVTIDAGAVRSPVLLRVGTRNGDDSARKSDPRDPTTISDVYFRVRFEVPVTPGVRLHHVMTVNLGAGTIDHVVNNTGAPVDNSNTGQPSFITEFP